MSLDIGIIGLPDSGRTTLFNALTGGAASAGGSRTPLIGTARVPDYRLESLAEIFHPDKIVHVSVTYIDIDTSLKNVIDGKGNSSQFLQQINNLDVLINVIRAFSNERIPHIEGSLDMERDISNMNLELTFYDLALLERRLSRIETSLKAVKTAERQGLLKEQEMIAKIKADLEKDIPVREMVLMPDESVLLSGYQLLSAKPLLIVINIDENQLIQADSLVAETDKGYSGSKSRVSSVCGELEMELSQLDDQAAEEFRSEYHLEESGSNRIIRLSYDLLGLITFFTTASNEVKAWAIQSGTSALKAAGKIHSDMERGFIRAEVISYKDMIMCGGLADARKKGLLRLEGKNYTVQDGDVITFLFNV